MKLAKFENQNPPRKQDENQNFEEESKQLYEKYLIDFERQNTTQIWSRELYNKTNPQNLIRYYISEVYQFFNNGSTMVYEKSHTEKTNDEKGTDY